MRIYRSIRLFLISPEMKNRNTIFLLLLLCITLCGCASTRNTNSNREKTNIDIQAMQIRQFDCSFKDAFASVIDVFQDQGFIIQTSDSNIGLIVAKGNIKNIANSQQEQNYRHSGKSPVDKNSYLVCTVRIEEIATNMTSIRVSFANETSEPFVHNSPNHNGLKKRGGCNRTKNSRKFIEDKKFYSNFFEKIDKSIFVRKNLKGNRRAL